MDREILEKLAVACSSRPTRIESQGEPTVVAVAAVAMVVRVTNEPWAG